MSNQRMAHASRHQGDPLLPRRLLGRPSENLLPWQAGAAILPGVREGRILPIDLSHWDFHDLFTVEECSYLIAGLDPAANPKNSDDAQRASVIAIRMWKDYSNARKHLWSVIEGFPFTEEEFPSAKYLNSEVLISRFRLYQAQKRSGKTEFDWLTKSLHAGEETDGTQFSRQRVVQWLNANNLVSKYEFEKNPGGTTKPSAHLTRWPWGNYTTAHLEHLAAAADRYWEKFDPSDPTTAHTNEEVSDWLFERTGSRRIADAMATILRADDLPTGPRTLHATRRSKR